VDNTFYSHVLDQGYAARINSLHNYLAVGQDVLCRWLHPISPDSSFASDYKLNRHNVYKRSDVQLGSGSVLEKNVILGPRCRVAEAVVLANASLAGNVQVGKNASLRDCVVLEGAVIGANCQVVGAVIGPKVVIGDDSVVHARCVVGEGVELPENTSLKKGTR